MSIRKNVAVFVGLTLAVAVAFGAVSPVSAAALTQAQIDAIIGLLQSFGADQSTISNVQASLTGGTPTGGTGGTGSYVFNANLTMGSKGADVTNLQKVLNSDANTQVAASGVGSAGNESSYFGALTKAAVIKFQNKYGITPAVGYVGAITRAKLNSMGGVVVVPPVTPPPVQVGTGLTVTAGAQPAAQLAPLNAARIPMTKVTFTAGSDGDVKVNSLVVERGGPSIDADVAGVVLLDESGTQVGLSKTLNSAHQVTLNESFTVKAGQSRTMTIAMNRPSADADSSSAGAVFTFSLVAVNTSATVTGSLPIVGTAQTGNVGLTIGSVTNARGPLDPAGAASKNVGTTGYTFSSVKVTAGSTEDVLIKSIRWNQASTASASDLANVVTIVEGVSYPTIIDSTGKYYTSVFGDGIKIEKGFSKEFSIKGDIISGSGRTIAFNLEKTTDLNIVGVLYGYGITPPTSGTGFDADSIWYAGSVVTVNTGSMTVTSDPSVAAQNVAINVANQPLGGFQVEVKGEPISVAQMIFYLMATGNEVSDITNVSLVNSNGAVLDGPVDGVDVLDPSGKVTFSGTMTFPVGITKLQLKGKLGTDFINNDTVQASTTPSSNWTTVVGQVTNQTITPSSSVVTSNTMTVKAAALTISILSDPVAQTVVAGGQNFVFTKYQLDAGASGEDLRIASIPLYLTSGTSANATELSNCILYSGDTALNTGNNAVNPTLGAPTAYTFTFDSAMTVAKGTTKTLSLKCNIASGGTSTHKWGINSSPTVTGVTSGQDATVTTNTGVGNLMTLASGGTLTVTLDSSSPSYRVVAAGTTGNTVGTLRFHASNEDMSLQTVPLVMNPATSTSADITQVTLWDGATQVGTATFDGTRDSNNHYIATSTIGACSNCGTVTIPKDSDKTLTVKVDLPTQGVNQGGNAGAWIKVNWDGGVTTNATSGTKAIGSSSGTAVYATGSDTAASGIRVFKSFPTITYSTVGAAAQAGVNDLLSVIVTADSHGDIKLNKLSFLLSTTTATLTSLTFSGPNGNVSSTTNMGYLVTATASTTATYFDSTSNTSDATVSAGSSKTYTMRGVFALAGTNTTGSVGVSLMADAYYPSLPTIGTATTTYNMAMSSTTGVAAGTTSNTALYDHGIVGITNSAIIWSPVSTTSSVGAGYDDWTNGYGLGGCFASSGLGQNCTARVLAK